MRVPVLVFLSLICVDSFGQSRFYVGADLGQSAAAGVVDTEPEQNFFGPATVDNLVFDAIETSWSVQFGWNIRPWLSLELGFQDLGNIGLRDPRGLLAGDPEIANLDVEHWYVGPTFTVPLSDTVSASWLVGIADARFSAGGNQPEIQFCQLGGGCLFIDGDPYLSPPGETGLIWGFGFARAVGESVTLELRYRRHELRLLDSDVLSIGIMYSL